jgi:microcystin-dependent protein
MSDTTTVVAQLLLMGDGSHPSDWGVQSNLNLQKLEAAASGATVLTLSGGSYALSNDDARAAILVLNGALTSDQTLIVPARRKKWLVINNTTGHNVIIAAAGSSGTPYTSTPASGPQEIYTDGTDVLPTLPAAASQAGFMSLYAGSTLPSNYLWCDGKPYSRTTYAGLFTAIGIAYGAGDGTTTFNVPDYRGRVPMGADNMGGTAASRITSISNALGTVGGEEKHALTIGELAAHGHGVTDPGHGHGVTDPGHVHALNVNAAPPGGGNSFGTGANDHANTTAVATTGITVNSATTGISIASTGSGTAHNNLQPLQTCNIVIHI